jgi:hypothetical protein
MRQAYFFAGESEEGIQSALLFGERALALTAPKAGGANPDIIVLRYGLCSVEDARKVRELAQVKSAQGGWKLIVVSAGRIFHEAQNALLKLFEEPPEKTMLVLVIGSEGQLLPTLRSRLAFLPNPEPEIRGFTKPTDGSRGIMGGIRGFTKPTDGKPTDGSTNAKLTDAAEFLKAGEAGRKKMIEKILARAKSDKDEEKQAARLEALSFAEGLVRAVYLAWRETRNSKQESENKKQKTKEYQGLLEDLERFIPILHERSAPLKLILEHLLIVFPKKH